MTPNNIIWSVILTLGVIYGVLCYVASNGYGYTGYNGNYHGTSRLYFWNSTTVYNDQSIRTGSATTGGAFRGGGPSSGK